MAFVFGIDGVPIFEMLTVISILLLAGLIFVLLELRRLGALIGKENVDLKRFESDLSEFENDTGRKSTDELVEYIRNSVKQGMAYSQIESLLMQRGWPKKEIDDIIKKISG